MGRGACGSRISGVRAGDARVSWPDTVRKSDLRIDCVRGSGPGGQHRNKTSSAVRITHILTGLVGYAEDERSQHRNKRVAFRRLAAQLVPLMQSEELRERYAAGMERIRTYHEPQQRVTDHRLPGQRWRYSDVLDGSALTEIVDALGEPSA